MSNHKKKVISKPAPAPTVNKQKQFDAGKIKEYKKNDTFDAVKFMRQVRDKISLELEGLTTEQILEYFRKREKKERIMPSH